MSVDQHLSEVWSALLSLRTKGSEHDKEDEVLWLRALADQVLDSNGVYFQLYDIVLMDPPHGIILDILFGRGSLVRRASKLAHGLLIYVGHDSQASRSGILGDRKSVEIAFGDGGSE